MSRDEYSKAVSESIRLKEEEERTERDYALMKQKRDERDKMNPLRDALNKVKL